MIRTCMFLILSVVLINRAAVALDQIDVTAEGARGDAVKIIASSQSGSPVITLRSDRSASPSDVGKVVMLYGAGVVTTGSNHQDLVARVIAVPDATHLKLSAVCGIAAVSLQGILGTDNAPFFQRCVDSNRGTNTVIAIPPGNYLLLPKDLLNPRYEMESSATTSAAVVIRKGGVSFRGSDPKTTILMGCGAWQLKGRYVSRGMLFECRGPISAPELPLVFENLTFDGGVPVGWLDYRGFPARTTDGSGWDMTHGAVLDRGAQPLHAFKAFRNCVFQHWRGEILKGVSGSMSGFVEVRDCAFHDGNASAFNFDIAHHIDRCFFSHLDMAMEFYEGRMDRPSSFENSRVEDVRADLVIVGALSNRPSPPYTIRNNDLQADQFGVFINPAKNVLIESNRFEGQGFCIGNGAGVQGTDYCHDIVIRGNTATNTDVLFLVQCGYENRMENIVITGNIMSGKGYLGSGWGYSTNVCFSNNIATNGASGFQGGRLTGQWFYDDPSDKYPSYPVWKNTNCNYMISYANGARQNGVPAGADSIFMLDDSEPAKIPSGAEMMIGYHGNNTNGSPLFLSSSHPSETPDAFLGTGKIIYCKWKNGAWQMTNDEFASGIK